MKHIAILFLSTAMLLGCGRNSLCVEGLSVDALSEPLGINTATPRFSWKTAGEGAKVQTSYQVQVASDPGLLKSGKADIWDSGLVESPESVMVPYGGKKLEPLGLYWWRVRTVCDGTADSEWSKPSRFSVGPLEGEGLLEDYIGLEGESSSLVRGSFKVKGKPQTALLSVNSLGYHEIYINGKRVGEAVLSPAVSQLDKTSLCVTYDVTPYLSNGSNEIVFWLGKGWYKSTTFKAAFNGPLVRAALYAYDRGRHELLARTDGSWEARPGGYTDLGTWHPWDFVGERIDASVVPVSMDGLDSGSWKKVSTAKIEGIRLNQQMCEPNRIFEKVAPKEIVALDDTTWVVDMGKAFTGWFSLKVPEMPEGHKITVNYSDYRNADGTVKPNVNERDEYICSGRERGDVFCNKFHHHAYQCVVISGLSRAPQASEIEGLRISGDYRDVSSFECSDKDLNDIHNLIKTTVRNLAFSGYMVDCPHIERMGYGGDGHASTLSFQTMYDVSGLYYNWLQSWIDFEAPDGGIPHNAPVVTRNGGGPYWCEYVVKAPWLTWMNYGDPRLLEECWPLMHKFLAYAGKYTSGGILGQWPNTDYRHWYLGDWLAPKGVDVKDPESVTLIANCVMSDTFGTMAKISAKLGKNDEAKEFEARKKELNELITKTFYHAEEGFYGSGSQLDMVYPLLVGAVPDGLREKVLSTFFERCRDEYNAHIAVGLVGVAILSEWAVEAGEADFMYGMLKKEDYPGYLYMLRSGATTTWENWDTPRSHIHNCFNGIASWFYQGPGGIRQEENVPAYRSVIFDPQIPEGLSWAKTSIDTPYGLTSLDWKKDGQSLVMDVRVPVGARGFVVAPEGCSEATVDGEKVSLVRNGSSLGIRLGAGSRKVVFR